MERLPHLRTLGGLGLEPADFRQPKPLLLLAYLAFEGAQSRRHWPSCSGRRGSA
jgi:hypothetical protein